MDQDMNKGCDATVGATDSVALQIKGCIGF
jgi:hypothetical protein